MGQKCSLHMKTFRVTGSQILAGNCDSQKGKAQAGITQEWEFLLPVKLIESTCDFLSVSPEADKLLQCDFACTNEKASSKVEVVHSNFSIRMSVVLVT